MFVFSIRTYIRSIEEHGYPLEGAFFSMFSRDAITLALSDGVLILSTGICVPVAKAIQTGWIRYYWTGVVLQHLWQTFVLFTVIEWTFNRHWPWVQSGFLTLHSLVLVMKMHSYVTTNGQLHWVNEQAKKLFEQLQRAVADEGGWEDAFSAAQGSKAQTEDDERKAQPYSDGVSNGTPLAPEGSTTSYVDGHVGVALRKRLVAAGNLDVIGMSTLPPSNPGPTPSEFPPERPTQVNTTGTRLIPPAPASSGPLPAPHTPSQILSHHPNPKIADLAREHADLEVELTSTGPERVRWPENITLRNFAVYMAIPTLVYELEYPRTDA